MASFRKYRSLSALTAGIALGATLLTSAGRPAHADATGDTMRMLATKYRGAAVMLTVVVRMSGTGSDENTDTELNVPGFFVDPSGLVVTTDSAIDPASIFASLMGDSGTKITSKVVSAKILTMDEVTIPAQVVLRDSDRNIAFIRPTAALAAPATFVDLNAPVEAHIGDAIFCVAQMGKTANHSLSVTPLRVIGVMERPRTLYIPDALASASMGNAVFTEQGVPLGMVSMRFSSVRGGRGSFFGGNDSVMPIVVPASDVAEEIKQALAAKAPAATTKPAATAPAATKPASGKPAPTKPK